MFSTLPNLYTHNNHPQSHYIPSPLSSSPLRNSPSPLADRHGNVPSSPSPMMDRDGDFDNDMDADSMMSSPLKPYALNLFISSSSSRKTEDPSKSQSQSWIQSTNTTPTNVMVTPPSQNRHDSVYSKRTTKTNPLLHSSPRATSNEGRETRRKLFLKRVRDVADEKRWKSRGIGKEIESEEEVLRCIWMQEERKREEMKRREALGLGTAGDVEDLEGQRGEMSSIDQMMADQVARDEEREVEEYSSMAPGSGYGGNHDMMYAEAHGVERLLFDSASSHRVPTTSRAETETLYGSDDDEYDEIFMDVIGEEQRMSISMSQQQMQLQQQLTPVYMDDEEMMDMS